MSHRPTPWHCALDWLGKSVVALVAVVGLLYVSAYTTGFPNLPDPDKQWRKDHGKHHPKEHCARELQGL